VPADEFEDIEPIYDSKGRLCRRVRHKKTGVVGTEVHADLIDCSRVQPKPMTIPEGSIFRLDYHYGPPDSSPKEPT